MKKISYIYRLFRLFRKEQYFLVFLIIIDILLTAYVPLQIKRLIDAITAGTNWEVVLQSGLIVLIVTIINLLLDLFKNYRWHRLRYRAINFLRLKMFSSLLKKPIYYFQKNSLGEITAKTLDDVTTVAQQGVIGPAMLFANIFNLIVSVILLSILEIKLSIIVMIFIPIYYLLFNVINPSLQKSSNNERIHYSQVMKDCQEKILGIRTIKIFKKEKFMQNNFAKVLDNHFFHISKNLYYYIIGNGITGLMVAVLPVVILLYGGSLVFKGAMTLGVLVAFHSYLGNLYEPIKNLSDYHLMMQNTLGMCERVLSFMDNDESEDPGKLDIDTFQSLQFKNVSFSYVKSQPILEDINFRINQGDRVLIIGQSGSGKSTLLNLMMKFYQPDQGQIILNNQDLREISKESLYSHFTLLEQNNFLFDGTIKDNITFGDDIQDDKIVKSAEMAKLTSLIKETPEGFAHRITELGLNLSGGEKQRICLARTLIREADLVILDEATSSLDSTIESDIIRNLDTYLKSKTLIAVSHRPALLEICNKVIHVENGHLLGVYSLDSKSDYAKIYDLLSQTG